MLHPLTTTRPPRPEERLQTDRIQIWIVDLNRFSGFHPRSIDAVAVVSRPSGIRQKYGGPIHRDGEIVDVKPFQCMETKALCSGSNFTKAAQVSLVM